MRPWRLALVALAGCALTSKAAPREQRYFSIAGTAATAAAAPVEPGSGAALAALRLGHVTASAYLRYPIEHRTSAVEIAPYETLRWTEMPDAYARRSLEYALFDTRAFEQATAGPSPVVDVEVVAFEEVARADGRGGRVALRYELRDDRRVVTRGTVTVERAAAGAGIEGVVVALGGALDAATAELAARIAAATVATDAPH